MPDWFYRTIGRECLARLPDSIARGLALGMVGALGRSAPGRSFIDLLGHMRPPAGLAGEKRGVSFATRVGLGPWVDPEGRATRALARFGAGFIEVGPVSIESMPGELPSRDVDSLRVPEVGKRATAAVAVWRRRMRPQGRPGIPVWVRIAAPRSGDENAARQAIGEIASAFADIADVFVVERATPGVRLALPRPWLHAGAVETAGKDGSVGCVLDPSGENGPSMSDQMRAARARLGPDAVIVAASGGDPADLVALLEAGADLVEADAALVFTGPGVIKRTNELLADESASDDTSHEPAPRRSWFWGIVLGGALAAGGLITLVLALGQVLLPYDEHYLGTDAAMLQRLMPRVHAFMAHDRATLAGTMLGLGAFYAVLAGWGMRRGQHWGQVTVVTSALAGFASFFSFLGFGYFDPLHAFVSAVLLQFTLCAMVTTTKGKVLPRDTVADARSDRAWLRGQWGQLLLVVHAVGLLGAGAVISVIGMTSVFVATDLAFLCATPGELGAFNDRLVGVIAHDRATLGGMLLASGVAQGLATLWGFRRGRAWLWTALLAFGLPAYAAAIGVHIMVGYTSAWHLAPALAGMALWAAGLGLTGGWLRAR